jgi:membrane protein YqaA with SNARE-associated domain
MTDELLALVGLFVSAFVSSTVAPGGSEAVLAYLLSQDGASIAQLVLVASIGNTLGALSTWWLGIWVSKKYTSTDSLSGRRQQALQTVKQWGCWALLLSWIPIIGDALCFAAGWLRLSLTASVVAIFVGKTLRYVAVALAFA